MTRFTRAAGVIGDVGLAVILVLLLPLVLIIVGAPVVLLVRGILAVVERF
jgi:hypothetical protein